MPGDAGVGDPLMTVNADCMLVSVTAQPCTNDPGGAESDGAQRTSGEALTPTRRIEATVVKANFTCGSGRRRIQDLRMGEVASAE
jgi:hypothetical protein